MAGIAFSLSRSKPSAACRLAAAPRSSAISGWETAVWAPKALLEAPARALWWTIALTALLAFMLVLALALWLGPIIPRSVGPPGSPATPFGAARPAPHPRHHGNH